MDGSKTFEEVYGDMNVAYNDYLHGIGTGTLAPDGSTTDRLWELCHQVLSNALYVLNSEDEEDVFTYEFPKKVFDNPKGVIAQLLKTGMGVITKVSTIPSYGTVWFGTNIGTELDDDDSRLAIWEIFNIATALYKVTEPLADVIYDL